MKITTKTKTKTIAETESLIVPTDNSNKYNTLNVEVGELIYSHMMEDFKKLSTINEKILTLLESNMYKYNLKDILQILKVTSTMEQHYQNKYIFNDNGNANGNTLNINIVPENTMNKTKISTSELMKQIQIKNEDLIYEPEKK